MPYDLHMETAAAGQNAQNLGTISSAIQQAWTTAHAAIISAEAGLGNGELGILFMSKYRPAADAVNDATQRHTDAGVRLSVAAKESVNTYQLADEASRQKFRELTGA
ncbi:hypothetical protein [Fodinicola acaciae]|uniref:hypothetical protein n=1 Tax=Fodinicola acaciae TaxID=2681555 RepID=UPI0013D42BB0|nr:hypothetical protein [Fodinicola acaciae]